MQVINGTEETKYHLILGFSAKVSTFIPAYEFSYLAFGVDDKRREHTKKSGDKSQREKDESNPTQSPH